MLDRIRFLISATLTAIKAKSDNQIEMNSECFYGFASIISSIVCFKLRWVNIKSRRVRGSRHRSIECDGAHSIISSRYNEIANVVFQRRIDITTFS